MAIPEIEAIVAEYGSTYPPLIGVEQAGEIAHVPSGTIHAWSSAGRLGAFKVRCGRRVLFHRDAFVRFVLGQVSDGDVDRKMQIAQPQRRRAAQ